jgi:glycosyltransferase involved in cell wall biosynthesis
MAAGSQPVVSVLVAVRNGSAFLAKTIESVIGQTLPEWELVIVDDASDDATPDVVNAFSARDGRIRYHRLEGRRGPYGAANVGASLARGEYLVRTDADDVSMPTRLERQIGFLRSQRQLRACASHWRTIGADDVLLSDGGGPPASVPSALRWAVCVGSGFAHSTMCIERDAFFELGGYADLPLAADYGMWCAAAGRGWLGVVPETLVSWRKHGAQLSAKRLNDQRAVCSEFLREHLQGLTGQMWSSKDADALWACGRYVDADLRRGFAAVDRWERAWRDDADVTPPARRELSKLSLRVRARHARRNARGDVIGALSGIVGFARSSALSVSSLVR